MNDLNDKYRDLAFNLIRGIKNMTRGLHIVEGTIVEVDKTKFTCDIELTSNVRIDDLPLKVLKGEQASFIEIPKVDTNCLISFKNGNIHRPQLDKIFECEEYIVKIDNVNLNIKKDLFKTDCETNSIELTKDNISIKSDTSEITLTSDGFKLAKGNSGLKKTLTDILNELVVLKVVTPAGSGVVDPSNIANLQTYISELDTYLTD